MFLHVGSYTYKHTSTGMATLNIEQQYFIQTLTKIYYYESNIQ
jgi:hypothetical protein